MANPSSPPDRLDLLRSVEMNTTILISSGRTGPERVVFAATRLSAPGMFSTTIVGLPGNASWK
jgi:hypothetical protein